MTSNNFFSFTNIHIKTVITFTVFTCFYFTTTAQVSINTTNATPHTSSMLDISSVDKGLLIPRMSFTEMTAIVSPAEGLLVYVNSGATGLYQYRSGNWEKLFAFSGSLSNGGVLFGANASLAQNNNHFYWNDMQKYLGLGTNTPNAPLTVSSLLPPTGNGESNTWIVGNFGAQSGARLVIGTRDGLATIGATNQILTQWDTLSLNPGGLLKLPFYSGTSSKLLGVNSKGVLIQHFVSNGLTQSDNDIKLGGYLTDTTNINLNGKFLNFTSGGLSGITANVFPNSGFPAGGTAVFSQGFRTETNGVLNTIKIRAFSYPGISVNLNYEITEGTSLNGNVVYSGFVPLTQCPCDYESAPVVELPININCSAGQNFMLKLNPQGQQMVTLITDTDIYPYGQFFVNSYPYPTYDLRFQVIETEAPFNLFKIDALNKNLSINGAGTLRIAGLSGNENRTVIAGPDGTLTTGSSSIGTVTSVTSTAPLSVTNGSTVPQISISQANTSTSGFLSSNDWNTFNNKQNALPNANSSTSGILTGTDWNIFNNKVSTTTAVNTSAPLTGGGTLASSLNISMPQANTATNGYLSNTDWNTFNNKYNLPNLTNGSVLFSNGSSIEQKNSHFFWDNANNALGIGTNTPSAGLNIHGYGWNNGFRISQSATGGVGPAVFLDGDRDFAIISTSTGAGAGADKLNIYDATADQSRLVIDQHGAVGIGQNTPASKLDVNGTSGLKVSSSHNGSGYTDWVAANIGGQGDKRVVIGVFDTIATIGAHNAALDQWRSIAINPAASGNVGIGTTTPQYKLDVTGNQRVTGSILASGHVRQFVHQESVTVPGAIYPVINPITGGPTTPTYGETTAIWVHNLGYNPILMTSLQMVSGTDVMHHVNVSYRHADVNTVEFFFRNTSVNQAVGTLNVIVAN